MATPAEPRLARLAVLVVFVLAALARAQNRLQEDRPRRSLVDWYFFDASDSGAAVGNVGAAPLVEARRTERHFAQQGGSGSNWAASRSVPAGTGTSSQYAEYEGLTRCFSLAHGAEGVCVDASMPGACTQPLAYKATPWSQVPVCPAGLECCPMFATGPAEGDRPDLGASPSWDPYTFSYYPPPDCHRNHPHHHTQQPQQPQQPPMPVQQAEWSSPQAPVSSVPPRFGLAPTRQMAAQQPRPQAAPMPETLPMSPLQPPQDSLVPLIGEDAPGSSLQSTRKPGDLARQKCVEYEKWAPTVRFGPDKDCVPNHSYPIGGNPAVPNEFPHMAHLGVGRKNSIQWFCGGSLIAPTWVLTAAHCLYSQDRQVQWVRLGDQEPDTDKEEYNPQIIAVKQVVRHPEYRVLQAYNDVGLLRLAREPDLTPPYVRPACLQVDKQLKKDKLNLIGFGLTEENGDPAPVLMEVAIYRTPYEKCRKFFDGDVNLRMLPRGLDDNSQLCAGLDQVGKDACQGDSGGPLNTPYSPTCMLYVAGITSFGQGCGRGAPGVYTRVSHFVPWIESIVWPGE